MVDNICRGGVRFSDASSTVCYDGVSVDKVCRDGEVVYEVVSTPAQGFATSQISRVEDIQPATNDANAQLRMGVDTDAPVACAPAGVHIRNGGIDTLVLRNGAGPDNLCSDPGVVSGTGPVGAYITEVLSPATINGIAIQFVSASGVDNNTLMPLPAALQSGEPPAFTATGPWLARIDGTMFSPYVSDTFIDPATVGSLFAGVFADAQAPGMTSAGHMYTMNVVYKFRYTDGTIVSQAATLVAEARNTTIPM